MFTPSSERGGVGVGVTPPPPTTPASYSSASARVAAARRRSGLFATPGARRSPFGTPGRSTPLNRSLQTSQLVEASGQYAMESYGSSLPTLVMEALNFADRNVEISAVLSEEGWAWLVCGRRLLVWRYRQEESRPRLVNHQFRELTLPPSDLAHRAQLVVVYTPTEGQVPSCIAASPEGFVRYWATITHEASYCEVSTELQGQECESLVSLGAGLGCLLATTTSTTLLLQPSGGLGGGQTINVRHLKAPAGLLGGISRRVSSLMFGSMPTQAPEARLVRAVGVPGAQGEERAVLVLSANSLQKWYLAPGQSDRLVYECNVEKHIRESFVDHVWGRERAGATQLRVWLVDMQPAAGGTAVMILTAAVNPQVSQQLVYALATMETSGSTPPSSVSNFSVLKHSEYYQDSAENVLLAQRFLLCGSTAYIYNKNTVLCVSAVGEGDSGDRVEFSGASDSILGVGRSQRLPLFFSANHGIVSITPTAANTSAIGGLINESLMEEGPSRLAEGLNLTMGSLAEGGGDQDKATRLQAAFLHYSKSNVAQAQLLIEDLFPGSDTSQLDSAVIQLSTAVLDDIPATDPRWAEELKGSAGGAGAPTSLIVLNQLRDKMDAHQFLINFLQQMGLWQQLSASVVKDTRVATKTCLAEHGQRLAFAMALRNLHNKHQDLVDSAIKHVVLERGEVTKNKLTHADLFYRRVSQVEDIIGGVLRAQEEVLSADVAPRDAVATIHSVNKLLLSLLHTARAPSPTVPASATTTDQPLEHVPWTATRGAKGTRTLLLQQHQTTVQVGVVRAEDSATRSRLYSQLVELADFILADYQPHLQSLAALPLAHDAHQALLKEYRRDRYNLIAPLVEGEQYDQAVSLAEKYCDFRTLVEVCDRTNNQERLTQYMNMFGSEGFSDFVFRWYLETGKRGKLLSQGTGQQGGELARFLQDYSSLAWLHQINTQDFSSAHTTLRHLAQEETTYLSRKKTLLSLSKLSSLVSGGDGGGGDTTTGSLALEDDSLSLEEELIHYQEQLPESVLSAHFLDPDTMRVLSPTELVHMYTSEDNISANEFDFKKALDLLSFVGEEESEELRRLIWVRALQKNTWDHLDTDNPLQALSDTIFFRTVELAFTQGCEVRELLVPVEELMACEELEKLCQDANFTFLLRAGYEHIDKLVG